jgi:hypothetical protein
MHEKSEQEKLEMAPLDQLGVVPAMELEKTPEKLELASVMISAE